MSTSATPWVGAGSMDRIAGHAGRAAAPEEEKEAKMALDAARAKPRAATCCSHERS